jgi:thiamine transport system substrate-binding protein
MSNRAGRRVRAYVLVMSVVTASIIAATSCGGSDSDNTTITLVTHDSFTPSEGVLAAFTARSGITVKVVKAGDAGEMVGKSILSADDPLGDVMFGVDNTLLSRGIDNKLFSPYEAAELGAVDPTLVATVPGHEVTPVDIGDVCVNVDIARLSAKQLPNPASLDDLIDPRYRGQLVVENPATSSPGLAFLLATVATYGDKWPQWWKSLRDNGVKVVDGWEQAYNTEFSGSSGGKAAGGTRPLVVSYASSPAAEVIFAEAPPATAPTASMNASCFRQIEYAGVLRGTEHERQARQLIDFLIGPEFQRDLPGSMLVFPAVTTTPLPAEFTKWAPRPTTVLSMAPSEIAAHRDEWIEQWTTLVLR